MSCGVYRILNQLNGKCYVGSSVNIENRWFGRKGHLSQLKNSWHHSIKLQRAWNKYGKEAFVFEVLQECLEDQLDWLEAFWMTKLDAVDNGYNLARITLEDGKVVRRHSEEVKQKIQSFYTPEVRKMWAKQSRERNARLTEEEKKIISKKISIALTGRSYKKSVITPVSSETRLKISQTRLKLHLTRIWSEEEKKKLSETKKGKMSLWQKQRIAETAKDRFYSDTARAKISATHLGSTRTQEAKDKMSKAHLGKKHSEETKRKMSEAAKNRWNRS